MLLQEFASRCETSVVGRIVLLENQEAHSGTANRLREGVALVERALSSRRFGPYTLQAAICRGSFRSGQIPRRRTGRDLSRFTACLRAPTVAQSSKLNRAVQWNAPGGHRSRCEDC